MMKTFLSALAICTLNVCTVSAQNNLCDNGYMPFSEGVSFELTTYNKKDKVSSVVKHEITEVEGSTSEYTAQVKTQVFDDKGKPTVNGSYTIQCTEDGIGIDMSTMMSQESMAAFSSMDVDVTGDALIIPNTLSPGQTLPDGEMQMQASMSGMSLMKLNMQVTDRKVESRESITTPAGTFDCVKITQTTTLDGFGKNAYTSTSWYAKGVGMVRTENYDKKGELNSYTVLTAFNK